MILFIWCLNLGISIWNAYVTGKVWVEAKHAGGVHRFMAWMGYLMASVGFSWDILVLVGILLHSLGKITPDQATLLFQAGYVLLVPGFLFSGFAIMFQSWANAYRNHSVVNMGVAAYNTYANILITPLTRSTIFREPLAALSNHLRAEVGKVRRTV